MKKREIRARLEEMEAKLEDIRLMSLCVSLAAQSQCATPLALRSLGHVAAKVSNTAAEVVLCVE